MIRGHDKEFAGANLPVPARIRGAWEGRISGCLLGKPLEVLSFKEGREGVESYLRAAGAYPLRDYVPLIEGTLVEKLGRPCCRGQISRAEPDDDINYTVLSLLLLEDKGTGLCTEDVARAWLRLLPAGTTWTAERRAYRVLLDNMADEFVNGDPPGFDLSLCSDNEYNEWIGAQIRADLYGWVCPGRPELAAELARRDAALSHRGEGVYGAMFVASLIALCHTAESPFDPDARLALVREALKRVPARSRFAAVIVDAVERVNGAADWIEGYLSIHKRYAEFSHCRVYQEIGTW